MRLILELSLTKTQLSREYRRGIMSYIKNALTKYESGKFYNEFYSYTSNRNFCFAIQLSNPIIEKDTIHTKDNQIKLVISSSDKKTVFILFNALKSQQHIPFNLPNKNAIILNKIKVISGKKTIGNNAIYKIISPLCVREHNKESNKDYYYSIDNDKFVEMLSSSILRDLPEEFKYKVKDINIMPVDCKKTVVLHYGQYIECTLGCLYIDADNSVLNYIYDNGIGSRRKAGFGLLDIMEV